MATKTSKGVRQKVINKCIECEEDTKATMYMPGRKMRWTCEQGHIHTERSYTVQETR